MAGSMLLLTIDEHPLRCAACVHQPSWSRPAAPGSTPAVRPAVLPRRCNRPWSATFDPSPPEFSRQTARSRIFLGGMPDAPRPGQTSAQMRPRAFSCRLRLLGSAPLGWGDDISAYRPAPEYGLLGTSDRSGMPSRSAPLFNNSYPSETPGVFWRYSNCCTVSLKQSPTGLLNPASVTSLL